MVTAGATWGKAPERPKIRENYGKIDTEQTEEELLFNLKMLKNRYS